MRGVLAVCTLRYVESASVTTLPIGKEKTFHLLIANGVS